MRSFLKEWMLSHAVVAAESIVCSRSLRMKLHPLKNIPEPTEEAEVSLKESFLQVLVKYGIATLSLLSAGVLTAIYGAGVGMILNWIALGNYVSSGFAALGWSVEGHQLDEVGAVLGFVAFCLGLVRITRK
jgi:hypothetical protein